MSCPIQGNDDDEQHLVVLDASTLSPVGGEPVLVGPIARAVSVSPDGRTAVVVVSKADPSKWRRRWSWWISRRAQDRAVRHRSGERPAFLLRSGTTRWHRTVAPLASALSTATSWSSFDAVTGKVSPLPHAHDSLVESVTFAPDYASFVTTGQDGVVKLWETATHHLLGSILPLGPNHPSVRALFLAADRLQMVCDTGRNREWNPRADSWEAYVLRGGWSQLDQGRVAGPVPRKGLQGDRPRVPGR